MKTMVLLLLAGATSVVAPDGRRVEAGERCYTLEMGGKAIGTTRQTVRADRRGGRPIWDVVIHQRVPSRDFDMRDHFVLDGRDLRPIAFDNSRSGVEHVRLAYDGGRITGTKRGKDGAAAVAVAAAEPVWEGDLYGLVFGALPLRQGAEFQLPFYQYDKGLGRFALAVTGSETVQTPGGPVEAWTVDVDPGGGTKAIYLIAKSNGAELGSRAGPFVTRAAACGS